MFGHLIDTERVMGYRAFCIARGEAKALPGFDEKDYVSKADSEDHPVKELAHEFAAVRHANLVDDPPLDRRALEPCRECQWASCDGTGHRCTSWPDMSGITLQY